MARVSRRSGATLGGGAAQEPPGVGRPAYYTKDNDKEDEQPRPKTLWISRDNVELLDALAGSAKIHHERVVAPAARAEEEPVPPNRPKGLVADLALELLRYELGFASEKPDLGKLGLTSQDTSLDKLKSRVKKQSSSSARGGKA